MVAEEPTAQAKPNLIFTFIDDLGDADIRPVQSELAQAFPRRCAEIPNSNEHSSESRNFP